MFKDQSNPPPSQHGILEFAGVYLLLRCNTYLEFIRNNKFAITIVFGRTLPFPSIFQSGEFVKQLAYCFIFSNRKFYCYTYG